MVFSCVQPLEPGVRTEATGANQLNLTVSCQAPSTKADPFANYPAGVTELNENKIEHIDWFIFRDTTSGTAWQSGRVTFSEKSDGTTEFAVTSLNMDPYMTTYSDGKGYVFTIANYPDEEGHDVTFGNKTFTQIREMALVTEELGNLANSTFTPLNSFVMSSYAEPFTLVENTPQTVNAKLHRLAAKISLNISIVPYIDEIKAYISGIDTTRIEYVQTWYPDVAGIRAYMTYANKHTTLTPVDTNMRTADTYDDHNFFTYNSRGFVPSISTASDGTSTVTGTPFYSYPMKWETSDGHAPFIKIILKWEGRVEDNTKKENQGHYINHSTGEIRTGDTVVVNAHNKEGEVKTRSQNFYYKISLPSAHNMLHSNVWTKINLDVAVLGGVDEEQTVDVIGRYYVVDWNDPHVEGGGDLTAGKYLSLATARDTFYIYGGNSIEIPVRSSHKLTAELVRPTNTTDGYRWRNGAWETTRRPTDSLRITTATDGKSSFTFYNGMNTTIGNNLDCYQMKFNIRLSNDGGLTKEKEIVIIQYPSIYVDTKPGDYCFVNGFFGHLATGGNTPYYYRGTSTTVGGNGALTDYGQSNGQGVSGNIRVSYGNMTRTTTDEQNMIIISISSFGNNSNSYTISGTGAGTYEYVIADPRTDSIAANSLLAYNTNYSGTGANTTTSWPDTYIKVGSEETSSPNVAPGRNFIAPKFMISSTWGRNPGMSGNISFDMAQRRCATYQEAGYPAGRWRLPTEAEAAFIAVLQNYNFISRMFNDNTAYALSNGRGITVSGSSGTIGSSFRSLRCVYDLWYWGDEPFTNEPWKYVIAPGDTQLN